MLDVAKMLREDWLPGFTVELPGGGEWTIPGPESIGGDADGDGWFRTTYGGALLGLAAAEDEAEYRRAELGLLICLLTRNYRLAAGDLADLLAGGDGPDRLGPAIRRVAERHAAGLIGTPPPRSAHGMRGRWATHVATQVWAVGERAPSPATAGAMARVA